MANPIVDKAMPTERKVPNGWSSPDRPNLLVVKPDLAPLLMDLVFTVQEYLQKHNPDMSNSELNKWSAEYVNRDLDVLTQYPYTRPEEFANCVVDD
jgi:hypothetical protein